MANYKSEEQFPSHRLSVRVFLYQDQFVKKESKKSKGVFTEGDVYRQLLDEAINARKAGKTIKTIKEV